MSNDIVVQADSAGPNIAESVQPIFWVVRAMLPGEEKLHLKAFDDPEEAADHVTWLTPRAIGTIRTFECSNVD